MTQWLSRSYASNHDSWADWPMDRLIGAPALRPGRAAAIAAGALAALALLNHTLAKKAERDNPAKGKFLEVDGVRLHYLDRGEGETLVLLHGNGSMVEDFASSGLIEMAARKYRVIAFDRPGFGHSERPRNRAWFPQAQAELIHKALRKLGISDGTVLGHSWGTQVAIALALAHPEMVRRLVLASGYYYPSLRGDVVLLSSPAVPVIGDVLRYTLAPLAARAMWPLLMRKIFGPAPEPAKFRVGFPKAMAVRPSQLRASAAETAYMIPDAYALSDRYGELTMPVTIIAGQEDRLIDIEKQSARLHRQIKHSIFHKVAGAGHMVHQTAPDAVLAAIDSAQAGSARASERSNAALARRG